MTDPLVEQARQAGQAYIASFKGDRKAMLADVRRRQEQEGRKVVTLPPRLPRHDAPEKPACR